MNIRINVNMQNNSALQKEKVLALENFMKAEVKLLKKDLLKGNVIVLI